jgi:TonB-dependent starch-binding outer membrane protein SusC
MKKLLFLGLILLFPAALLAQRTISGVVVDENNVSLPGVNVTIKGTFSGTATDREGKFSLTVNDGEVLVFSFIGYKKVETPVAGLTTLNITLELDLVGMDEVVVIGYGTTTRKEITGSVTSVKSDRFISGDLRTPMAAIQGLVPGLSIVSTDGNNPNAEHTIRLRGLNSFSGGKSPLILVDGKVWNLPLSIIDPESIAAIDVLKDGSAAAIYGTRATNGVILISLKEPIKGDVQYQFSSFVSAEQVNRDNRWFTADEYRDLIAEYDPNRAAFLDRGHSTYWLDETTRTPINQSYSLAITGGDNKLNYRTNIMMRENQGLFYNNYSRLVTPSIYVSQTGLNNRLNVDYKLLYSNAKRLYQPSGMLAQSLIRNPTEPVYDEANKASNGYFTSFDTSGYTNPVAMSNESTNEGSENYVTGDFNASFLILEGFTANFSGSYTSSQNNYGTYLTKYYPRVGYTGDASRTTNTNYYFSLEPTLQYRFSFGGHNFQTLGGYSFYEYVGSSFYGRNYNFDTDNFSYNNLGAGQALVDGFSSLTSGKESNRLIAFYGRVMYNFQYKYLFATSLRYEGSSRFGNNNKWGFFPAVSLGWRLNEESFLKEVSWVNNLMLRAGYGVTGNQDIPNYQSVPRMAVGPKMFYNGRWINSYQSANNPNPDLKWEKKAETNIGVDFGLFNRISGSIEFYNRNITDLLWWYSVPVPPNVFNNIYANVGSMRNRGFELMLEGKIINNKDLNWTSTLVYSMNRNKVTKLADPSRGYALEFIRMTAAATSWAQMIRVGESIGNFWAPIYTGVDSQGRAVYEDVNNDGVVQKERIEDRRIVGNEYPDFEFGWQNIFYYKNFDFSFALRGMIGQSLLNRDRIAYENWEPFKAGRNVLKSILDRPEYTGPYAYDSRFVDESSFVKLSNVTLGYNLKGKTLKMVRLYVSGNNLITITKFEGTDPEKVIPNISTNTETFGADNLWYPYSRTFVIGLNLNF